MLQIFEHLTPLLCPQMTLAHTEMHIPSFPSIHSSSNHYDDCLTVYKCTYFSTAFPHFCFYCTQCLENSGTCWPKAELLIRPAEHIGSLSSITLAPQATLENWGETWDVSCTTAWPCNVCTCMNIHETLCSDRVTVQRRHKSEMEKSIIRPVIKSSDDLPNSILCGCPSDFPWCLAISALVSVITLDLTGGQINYLLPLHNYNLQY